ncbi:MAG: DUF4242 domain-containing protein [Candidatus Rokuibacteriota bacterium]|jgi:hypothetical protein|nr:MAG: DUF4242 domain-containing protein [Candidatus Rokubacteria bacterium]PYN54888.1 MAG: DUF4242 domain-containing protein [Candidatus Rokubacteria bacterium]
MPKYVIEREIPGAADLVAKEGKELAAKSNKVIKEVGEVQWLHSYVSADKLYCVYISPNEEKLREHAKRGGFPINRVSEVKATIDPTTGGR